MYKQIIFPLLRKGDAETVHNNTLGLLEIAQRRAVGRYFLRVLAGDLPHRPVRLMGLEFPNRLGIAAGFDKDVRVVKALALLGFGHVEVGTLTPRPQLGNPRPRLFRLPADRAIINSMGFPNCGAFVAEERLRLLRRKQLNCVLGVSLGKQKETPIEDAQRDFIEVMTRVYEFADYFAVNVSSPNTPDLRRLQGIEYIDNLLAAISTQSELLAKRYGIQKKPLLIKISPDLMYPEIDMILESALKYSIDGILATNTTVARDELKSRNILDKGGLSGSPLAQRSNEIIAYINRQVKGMMAIIGVGGVFTADDVQEKLAAGAGIVQLYTGLVYEGPGLAGRILRAL